MSVPHLSSLHGSCCATPVSLLRPQASHHSACTINSTLLSLASSPCFQSDSSLAATLAYQTQGKSARGERCKSVPCPRGSSVEVFPSGVVARRKHREERRTLGLIQKSITLCLPAYLGTIIEGNLLQIASTVDSAEPFCWRIGEPYMVARRLTTVFCSPRLVAVLVCSRTPLTATPPLPLRPSPHLSRLTKLSFCHNYPSLTPTASHTCNATLSSLPPSTLPHPPSTLLKTHALISIKQCDSTSLPPSSLRFQ